MSLQGGLQVVLQHPRKGGGPTCRGFTGLPNVSPAWFYVEPLDPADIAIASDIGDDIAAGLISLGSNVKEVTPPCGGHGLGNCHAENKSDCFKVLLPVVGAASGNSRSLSRWQKFGTLTSVCPVLSPSANTAIIPPTLSAINGVKWTRGDPAAISKILQLGGLLGARPRLFISYVRAESEKLAEQLHDYLIKLGFDVFLDRFSVKPGVDFQVRLTEELARMGTVLILETAGILKSTWVQHEVQFARAHRLGLVALQLPKGKSVPGVGLNSRIALSMSQFNAQGKLYPKELQLVGFDVQKLHAAAEKIRIAYMRDALSDALLLNGFTSQGFDVDGVIVAQKTCKEYSFAVRNLPPEIADFHAIEGHRQQGRDTFVIAPAKYMDWQTHRSLDWLSKETKISLEDEGDMVRLVQGLK